MKKINSVIFKDPHGQYYRGLKENNKISGFALLSPLSEESKQAIESIKQPLTTADFIVATITETKKKIKIEPLTCGTVYLKGDDKTAEAVAAVLYNIPRGELIDLLNSLIKPELLVDPVKKTKKSKVKRVRKPVIPF